MTTFALMRFSRAAARLAAPVLLVAGLAVANVAQAGVTIAHWVTPAGARVYFVETHALPMVDVQVDFAAGSARDPAGKSGLASFTHGLLDGGAGDLDETAIANRLADLGANLGGGVDQDRASLTLRTLSQPEARQGAFELLRLVLQSPRFPQAVLERERARSVAGLKDALTRPEVLANRAFWQALYPNHPYGRQATPESLAGLTRADVEAFWQANYNAAKASVTLVGDLTRAEAETLADQLTAGLPPGGPAAPLPAVAPIAGGEVVIAHPAAQSHLLLGLPAVPRGDPDFFALQVGNYVLGGGGFVSRLLKEVRDARGYAYSVYSYFMPLQAPGPFQIGLQTKRAQAGAALKVVGDVLRDFLARGATETELKAAKANLTGSFPLRLDSNRKILDNVAVIGFYGLPLNYLDTYAANVNKVTLADIRAAFARHVKQEQLAIVKVATE